MQPIDDAPEGVRIEMQILRSSLRQLNRHRRRLLRELAMAQLWRQGRTLAPTAKWLLLAAAGQREREIAAVSLRITQLEWKMAGLMARFCHGRASTGRHGISEKAASDIAAILLAAPACRHHSKP
jgi:hypothetical protein